MNHYSYKKVDGYDNYYCDTSGNVYKLYKNGVCLRRKPKISKKGYEALQLCKNKINKDMFIHRIVAMTFIPNPYNKRCIDHIDGNRKNNQVNNLRWATNIENNNNRHCNDKGYSYKKHWDTVEAYYSIDSKRFYKCFSCKKYGYDEAVRLAKEWRVENYKGF